MKVEIKKLKQANVEIDCQMEWQEFLPYYEKTLSDIVSKAEIKGFRAGKAPKDLVEKEIGKHKILQEAVEGAIKEIYFEAIRKNSLEPIGPPQVEILKLAEGNPLEFRIKAQVLPEVNLPDYQKIVSKIEKKKFQIRDEEVEEIIKWIQKSRANTQEIKGDLPELNDEFAKTVGNFESFEKLKDNIREGLTLEKENQNKEIWKDDILKAISDQVKIELPEILVLSEKERILHNLEHKTEELEKEAGERAEQRVKNYLILKEIGKKEGIEILEQDVEEEINKILASYPQTNPKEIDKETVKGVLYNNKVFAVLEKLCH